MRLLVVGAGGHGLVVSDILLRMQESGAALTILGYLDDNRELKGRSFLGLPVLGSIADLVGFPHDSLVLALGFNRTRERLALELTSRGERFAVACHPRSVVAPDVQIGPGTIVCGGVVINPGSVVGAHAILNTGSTIDHHNRIGDYAHIAPGVHLGGDVQIGLGTLVGIGATVMPGRSVGDWAVVGAGAVVTRDIPSGVTAIGIPARPRQIAFVGGTLC